MKPVLKLLAVAIALAMSMTTPFRADAPAGGIGGLSVSPDGGTILAAGDTRVICVINPPGMSVKRRI